MSERRRLPNRRTSETFDIDSQGLRFMVTASRYDDGRLGEIFITNHKAGSMAGINAADAAVVCSIALQHGVPVKTIRRALMRDAAGRPSGPLAAALDQLGRRLMRPEQQIHRAVVQHLRQRGLAGVVFTHPPNGGYRRPIEAAIFKSLGTRPGAPDLLLWHAGRSFALELKAPGGRVTQAQLAFLSDLDQAGVYTCLADGLDRALKALEAWGLLRGQAS